MPRSLSRAAPKKVQTVIKSFKSDLITRFRAIRGNNVVSRRRITRRERIWPGEEKLDAR